jgi:hypothetical protein
MPDADRAQLARQQAALVAALTTGAAPPADFDEPRVRLAARTLHRKRARAVAKTWPALAAALGRSFNEHFRAYADAHPLADPDPAADGAAFARHAGTLGLLTDAARVELALHRAARGWPVRLARFRESSHVAVALRLPCFGRRVFRLPFPQKTRRG